MSLAEKCGIILMVISSSAGMVGSVQAGWVAYITFIIGAILFLFGDLFKGNHGI